MCADAQPTIAFASCRTRRSVWLQLMYSAVPHLCFLPRYCLSYCSADGILNMDSFADVVNRASASVTQRPLVSLLASNAVTAAVALYIISEGRPLAFLYKHAFRAIISVVPKSIVDKEKDALRRKVEASVVGAQDVNSEPANTALPTVGLSKEAIISALERGSSGDRAKWIGGKVRAAFDTPPRRFVTPSEIVVLTSAQ